MKEKEKKLYYEDAKGEKRRGEEREKSEREEEGEAKDMEKNFKNKEK